MRRFKYFFFQYPLIFKRWWIHILWLIFPKRFSNPYPPKSFGEWWLDLFFYSIDLVGIPTIYESVLMICKRQTRRLSEVEITEAKKMFGDTIRYDLVLVDPAAKFGTKSFALAYVSFFTINYRKPISLAVFIHEMVHVWQYQNFGAVYISKAIKAQKSIEGYDYGGKQGLYGAMLKGKKITDFNFEQQAEIVEDHYRAMSNRDLSPIELSAYSYFSTQVYDETHLA